MHEPLSYGGPAGSSIRPEVHRCEELLGAYFDSQGVQKDSYDSNKHHENDSEQSQNEPGSAAAGLRGGLGDAKRPEKCNSDGFKKLHISRIRGVPNTRCSGYSVFQVAGHCVLLDPQLLAA